MASNECVVFNNFADQLGFAELCVCCEVGVAHARNHDRRIPIPNSTIINMEQRLELPEPIKHHWERRSSVLLNNCNKEEFLTSALLVIYTCTTLHSTLSI